MKREVINRRLNKLKIIASRVAVFNTFNQISRYDYDVE